MKEVVPLFLERRDTHRLICIGIGTHARSLEFCEHVGFDPQFLYSDAENKAYDALQFVKSTPATLFTDVRTPLAIAKRFADGKQEYLGTAFKNWGKSMWIPPRLDQGLQQGGSLVFKRRETIFKYKDPSAGADVDINDLLRVALAP